MGADDISQLSTARLGPGYTSGTRATARATYVDLDLIYGEPATVQTEAPATPMQPGADRRAEQRLEFAGVDGQRSVRRPGRLICSGEVPGTLHTWERDVEDRWVAIVSFTIPFTPGDPRPGKRMELVALPLAAVRPADPDSPGPRPPPHRLTRSPPPPPVDP